MAGLFGSIAVPERADRPAPAAFEPLTKGLVDAIAAAWRADPADLPRLRLAMRAGVAGASSAVIAEAAEPATAPARRRELLGLLADLGDSEGVPVALGVLEGDHPFEVQAAALDVLARHGDDRSRRQLLDRYPGAPAAAAGEAPRRSCWPGRRRPAPSSSGWTAGQIAPAEVPVDQLRLVALHGDPGLDALVRKHWGTVRAGTAEEKLAEVRRLANDLRAGTGDRARGQGPVRQALRDLPQAVRRGGRGRPRPDRRGPRGHDRAAGEHRRPRRGDPRPYLQYAAVTTGGRVVAGPPRRPGRRGRDAGRRRRASGRPCAATRSRSCGSCRPRSCPKAS